MRSALLFAVSVALSTQAATARRLVDLHPTPGAGSSATPVVRVGSVVLFTAQGTSGGLEPWRTDGTPAGTTMLRDVRPGDEGSFPRGWLAAGPDAAWFVADVETASGDLALGLFRTDGTTAGTRLVREFPRNSEFREPKPLGASATRLFFSAWEPATGEELWVSDGTSNGTVPVADLTPGATSSTFGDATVADGVLHFSMLGDQGRPWRSDGTTAGTFRQTTFVSNSSAYFAVDGGAVFTGTDVAQNVSTFRAQPADAGLDVLVPGLSLWLPGARVGERMVLTGAMSPDGPEPWITDGTAPGTVQLRDVAQGSSGSFPYGFTTVGDRVFYAATDTATGTQLWSTDGTPQGTTMVTAFPSSTSTTFVAMAALGTKLFFGLSSQGFGYEPWISDGTAQGTQRLADLNPGPSSSHPLSAISLPGRVVFQATNDAVGAELFTSDGTSLGTTLVKDLLPATQSSRPRNFVAHRAASYFVANDGVHGAALFSGPSADGGVALAVDLHGDAGPGFSELAKPISFGPWLVASANDGVHGEELYRSNGTQAGTELLREIGPGGVGSFSRPPFEFQDVLLFSPFVSGLGYELWRTDGTDAGTVLVKDLVPGNASSNPFGFTTFKNAVYFSAGSPSGTELWRTDGTDAGTTLVADLNSTGSSTPQFLTVLGDTLLFQAFRPGVGAELFASDGVDGGPLVDLEPGQTSSAPTSLRRLGNRVVFFATTLAAGNEPWVTDGTAQGTQPLKDVRPGVEGSGGSDLVVVGSLAYFTANDGTHGFELWATDGTPQGTRLVKDVRPGAGSSWARALGSVQSVTFVSADDGTHGRELWVTDGTEAGTTLHVDIATGPGSSFPTLPVVSEAGLVLSASVEGDTELYVLETSAAGGGSAGGGSAGGGSAGGGSAGGGGAGGGAAGGGAVGGGGAGGGSAGGSGSGGGATGGGGEAPMPAGGCGCTAVEPGALALLALAALVRRRRFS